MMLEELKLVEKEHKYEEFELSLKNKFLEVAQEKELFVVDVDHDLWDDYLLELEENHRQHYNCNCCKSFVRRYGNIVTINEDGTLSSAMWDIDKTPEFFKGAVNKLVETVESSRVKGVFISRYKKLGFGFTNGWGHLSLDQPSNKVVRSYKTDHQLMAEKIEDFKMLSRAVETYSKETIDKAITILKSNTLYRGNTQLGVAEWFKSLKDDLSNQRNEEVKNNIIWMYVAKAPSGYAHIRSSMIGTLLDDIQEGMSLQLVAARFSEKMNPANYQRSQSAPTASAIMQAEKMVSDLGIADSLQRRYAKLEEIPEFIWKDRNVKKEIISNGIFSGITPKQKEGKSVDSSLPLSVMTWNKFSRTVLPGVTNLEAKIDNASRFMSLVTENIEGSKNILQWNNPFSWYYHGGVDGEIRRRVEREGGKYEDNDIRISLIWDNYSDLDLHCYVDGRHHIYYGNKREYGGWLDVDMNVSPTSMEPVENIRFSNREARNGSYEVKVHNYTDRGNGDNPFKAELEVGGQIYSFFGNSTRYNVKQMVFKFDYYNGEISNLVTGDGEVDSVSSWGAPQNSFVKVKAITKSPNLWGEDNFARVGDHTFFLLEDVKDSSEGKGRGFFNEMLKPELKEIRKTLEAYTASSPINGIEESTAAGLGFNAESDWNLTLKVTENGLTRLIKIDRFD